jgi:hypothetical protein
LLLIANLEARLAFISKHRILLWLILLLLVILVPFLLAYGLIAESFIETFATAKENMNTLISAVLVLALIAVPSYLLIETPQSFTVPTQVMFSVFLTAASTWLGISINNKRARRDATGKWLPAAETACKQLLTLSATAERMKRTQARACTAVDPLLPQGDPRFDALKVVVELQCRETAEKLATLRDHIENAISHWQVFIGANCEGADCVLIEARLQECRERLFSQLTVSQDTQTPDCIAQPSQQPTPPPHA